MEIRQWCLNIMIIHIIIHFFTITKYIIYVKSYTITYINALFLLKFSIRNFFLRIIIELLKCFVIKVFHRDNHHFHSYLTVSCTYITTYGPLNLGNVIDDSWLTVIEWICIHNCYIFSFSFYKIFSYFDIKWWVKYWSLQVGEK